MPDLYVNATKVVEKTKKPGKLSSQIQELSEEEGSSINSENLAEMYQANDTVWEQNGNLSQEASRSDQKSNQSKLNKTSNKVSEQNLPDSESDQSFKKENQSE